MRWINAIGLVGVVLVNYLAAALPLNGVSPKDVSDRYFNEFAPIGYTFSIWGVIYLLLTATIIWQFIGNSTAKSDLIARWSWVLPLNFALNAAWLFCWHYDFIGLSVVIMLGILWTLVRLNALARATADLPQRQLIAASFGIYLGWICIATVANFTVLFVKLGWNGFGLSATFWTGAIIGTAAVIATWLVVYFRNMYIGFAVIWALFGIAARQMNLHNAFTPIAWAALTWAMPVATVSTFLRSFVRMK